MFSIRKLFGKEEKFFDLLEASAEEARSAAGCSPASSSQSPGRRAESVDDFVHSRAKTKRITSKSRKTLPTLCDALEQRRYEALAFAPLRIPKMSEKDRPNGSPSILAVAGGRSLASGRIAPARATMCVMVVSCVKGRENGPWIREANEKLPVCGR